MIDAELDGNTDEARRLAEEAAWEAIARVTVYYWQQVTQALNASNPRPHTTPSLPGEPPRKRTGWLQRHVQYRLDREQSRGVVGVAAQAPYGLALELGTKNMAARPFLLSTLEKYREQLQAIARG